MLRRLLKRWRGPSGAPDVAALVSRGTELRKAGRVTDSESALLAAIATAPRSAPSHVHLGIVLAERGQLDEATELFSRATILDPGDPFAQMNLANAHRRCGALDQALVHYRAAVRLQPDLPVADRKSVV